MTRDHLYPEEFDQQNPTPEQMELWDEAIIALKRKRNLFLIWQVPFFIIFWLSTLAVKHDYIAAVWVAALVAFGFAAQGIYADFNYKPSEDRKSATLVFSHKWSFKRFFEIPVSAFVKAQEGFGGLLVAIISFFTLPFWWGFVSFFYSFALFNKLWWLKDFYEWRDYLLGNMKSNGDRTHVRGTNILPSVQLSGTGTTGGPPPLPPRALEVLDGVLSLQPDGGIVVAGGASFDRHSSFSGFSINGVTLTRESEELLKASRDGSDFQFRFDGGTWQEV